MNLIKNFSQIPNIIWFKNLHHKPKLPWQHNLQAPSLPTQVLIPNPPTIMIQVFNFTMSNSIHKPHHLKEKFP